MNECHFTPTAFVPCPLMARALREECLRIPIAEFSGKWSAVGVCLPTWESQLSFCPWCGKPIAFK